MSISLFAVVVVVLKANINFAMKLKRIISFVLFLFMVVDAVVIKLNRIMLIISKCYVCICYCCCCCVVVVVVVVFVVVVILKANKALSNLL